MSNVWYTRDDANIRHYVVPGRISHSTETVCGKQAYKPEPLALPINCDECRTQNGKVKHMKTEEVVEMIDAITEGREFTLHVDTCEDEPRLTIKFTEEISLYGQGGYATAIDTPRTAREIAGALVAWANRKDQTAKVDENGNKTKTFPDAVAFMNKYGMSTWRSKWYAATVHIMSQEVKNQNLKDLREIINDPETVNPESDDVLAAIRILLDNGAV